MESKYAHLTPACLGERRVDESARPVRLDAFQPHREELIEVPSKSGPRFATVSGCCDGPHQFEHRLVNHAVITIRATSASAASVPPLGRARGWPRILPAR